MPALEEDPVVTKTPVKERRAHERHATQLAIQGSPEQGGVVARMVARNLSVGGLYCTSPTDFPEMTRMAVRLMLPMKDNGEQPVDLEAVVVRREELAPTQGSARYELGLFFTNLDATTREQIETFLSRRAH
jgi:hypothetical protein